MVGRVRQSEDRVGTPAVTEEAGPSGAVSAGAVIWPPGLGAPQGLRHSFFVIYYLLLSTCMLVSLFSEVIL